VPTTITSYVVSSLSSMDVADRARKEEKKKLPRVFLLLFFSPFRVTFLTLGFRLFFSCK
jgi:hypothetical protein